MQVDPAVALARDRAAHDVDQSDDARPEGAGRPHRLERVRGLSRLRDRDRERTGQRNRPPVAVLGRVLDGHRNLGQALEDVPAHEPGMPRRSARDDRDVADGGAVRGSQVEPVEPRHTLVEHEAAAQRGPHGLGLLADLLLHEMRVTVQLDRLEIPRHVVHLAQQHV